MLSKRNRMYLVSMMVVAATALGACATPTAEPTMTSAPTVAPAPENTATPEPAPAPGPTAVPEVGVPVIEPPAAGDPAAVANYNTYIFGGPGVDYVVYGAFLGSEAAKVVGRNDSGSWWAISVPPAPGGIGWVDAAWVTVSGADGVATLPAPPVPATADLVPPGPEDPQATVLVNTYVRTGPGDTFPAYGVAPAGATARVIGKSSDGAWWVVRLDPLKVGAGYGWTTASTVQAANVDAVLVIAPPDEPTPLPPPAVPEGAAAATAIDYVYVRSGAGTCYAAYGVAAPGAMAEVAGKSSDGQWWQVKISTEFVASGLAWVSAGYVTTANAASVPAVETEPCAEVPPPPQAATYTCFLSAQDPEDNTAMEPGSSFTMVWTMQNTGAGEWTDATFRFVQSGALGGFHTGPDSIDIGTIAAGASYSSSIPALAPSAPGTFGEVWEIVSDGDPVCGVFMIITVAE